jgi:hypothetical protein
MEAKSALTDVGEVMLPLRGLLAGLVSRGDSLGME